MAKRAIVTGASGFLGRQVVQRFKDSGWSVVGTGYSRVDPPAILKVDLSDTRAVADVLEDVKPHVLIHCAANRYPDKCDQDPDGARRLNVEGTRQLFQACVQYSITCIYISTDYVFAGTPGEAPYEPDAATQPTNLYGRTKLEGEWAALDATTDSQLGIVLRIPVLYGKADDPSESAVNVLVDAVWNSQKKDAMVKMDDWAWRYPTNTEDVARVCYDVATKYLDEEGHRKRFPRILQFTSEDGFTKYGMCQLFSEILGLPLDNVVADAASPKGPVQRPFDTHLSTRELRGLDIDVSTQDFKAWWRRELKAYKK